MSLMIVAQWFGFLLTEDFVFLPQYTIYILRKLLLIETKKLFFFSIKELLFGGGYE